MKKYTTDWKSILMIGVSAGVLMAFTLYLNRNPDLGTDVAIKGLLIWVIFWAFFLLITTCYSYASITNNTLTYVYLFFYRRTVNIDSITEINDQATYKTAKGSFRSLYIFYKDQDGSIKYIEFRITLFSEKTLGRLVKDLKQLNPNIELSGYAEKLAGNV
ncbi:MAG: hypothetical protein JWL87_134 [Candidatus Adlerbacteria bacterium]|nr:hypothetical protein [Candidatus Adlerbacteria bacterium]